VGNMPKESRPDPADEDAIEQEAAQQLPTREVLSIVNPSGGMFGSPPSPSDPPFAPETSGAETEAPDDRYEQ
jgi:hypothetical protein